MERDASLSPDRRYRYVLTRSWRPKAGFAVFIGLNPSTADERQDDATIRRCLGFAAAWGYGGIAMLNLFAFRARYPRDLLAAADPVGPSNDEFILTAVEHASVIVACWGTLGDHRNRAAEVRRLVPNLHYLRLTREGHPSHPLYLPKSLRPQRWVHGRVVKTTSSG